jgi:DNA-binding NarL/FixJ family response regulator
MPRILIVDDHPIVREGLAAIFADDAAFEPVGGAGTIEDAIAQAGTLGPDVIVLDLDLPGVRGAAGVSRIRAAVDIPILIFTAYDSEELVLDAIEAGASGYLLKGAPASEIRRAAQDVADGGSYLSSRIAGIVMGRIGGRRALGLSKRETEVLRLAGDGRSNKQIAAALTVSEATVKFHLNSAFAKLGADNRAQAVRIAVERGLLS